MKKVYEQPVVEVVSFQAEDYVTDEEGGSVLSDVEEGVGSGDIFPQSL